MKIAALLHHRQCLAFLSENNLEAPTIPSGCNTIWRDLVLADDRHAVIVNQTGFKPMASDNEEQVNGLSLYIADEPPSPSARRKLHEWIEAMLAPQAS
jgi:hypothetical protein